MEGLKMIYDFFLKKAIAKGIQELFIKKIEDIKNQYPLARLHRNPFVLFRMYREALHEKINIGEK
ncbi:hypothetical protein [Yersinia bercovieri]|nr:hypothetical protein [Yersinia bercovieri]